jgi:hypothetical protein
LILTSGAFILPGGFIAGMTTYCRIFITGMIIAGFPVGWTDRGLRGYLAAAFCLTRSMRVVIV